MQSSIVSLDQQFTVCLDRIHLSKAKPYIAIYVKQTGNLNINIINVR